MSVMMASKYLATILRGTFPKSTIVIRLIRHPFSIVIAVAVKPYEEAADEIATKGFKNL